MKNMKSGSNFVVYNLKVVIYGIWALLRCITCKTDAFHPNYQIQMLELTSKDVDNIPEETK